GRTPLAGRWTQIEKAPATDGPTGGGIPENEIISHRSGNRVFEHQLDQASLARIQRPLQRNYTYAGFKRMAIEHCRKPDSQRFGLALQQHQLGINARSWRMQFRRHQLITAMYGIFGDAIARQIQCATLSCN